MPGLFLCSYFQQNVVQVLIDENAHTCQDFFLSLVHGLDFFLCFSLKQNNKCTLNYTARRNDLIKGEQSSIQCPHLLINTCNIRLCPRKKSSDEVGVGAHCDVIVVGYTDQTFINGRLIFFLFFAVQLPRQDFVCLNHFILTLRAKPADTRSHMQLMYCFFFFFIHSPYPNGMLPVFTHVCHSGVKQVKSVDTHHLLPALLRHHLPYVYPTSPVRKQCSQQNYWLLAFQVLNWLGLKAHIFHTEHTSDPHNIVTTDR